MDLVPADAIKAGPAPGALAVPSLDDEAERQHASARIAVRAQAALVRSLAYEIDRRSSADARMTPLHEQLDEEAARLGRYVRLAARG